jgi:hypothetical protein
MEWVDEYYEEMNDYNNSEENNAEIWLT